MIALDFCFDKDAIKCGFCCCSSSTQKLNILFKLISVQDDFLLATVVKSDYMSYYMTPGSINKSYHFPLIFNINKVLTPTVLSLT